MSLPIILGTGAVDWKGDTNGSGNVALYGPDGKVIYKRAAFTGLIRVPNQRLTAAIASGSLIWSFRYNGGAGVVLRVKSGILSCGFDGIAASTTQEYQIVRISAANPTGGSTIQPVKTIASTIPSIDARFNYAAALTVAGVTIDAEFAVEWGCARQLSAGNQLILPGRESLYGSFLDLLNGEGFAIRLGVTAVIGDSLGGYFELQEYATTD